MSSSVIRSLRFLTYNTYLIPGWFVNRFNSSCLRQAERADAIGKLVVDNNVDVVFFQEVWGSNTDKLERRLTAGSNCSRLAILPGYESWGGTWIDTLVRTVAPRGGLYGAYRSSFVLTYLQHQTFSFSNSRSRKGVLAALLDIRSHSWNGVESLLVFCTHLDPTNLRE